MSRQFYVLEALRCPRCKGTGSEEVATPGYHDHWGSSCKQCGGAGTIWAKINLVEALEIFPSSPDDHVHHVHPIPAPHPPSI